MLYYTFRGPGLISIMQSERERPEVKANVARMHSRQNGNSVSGLRQADIVCQWGKTTHTHLHTENHHVQKENFLFYKHISIQMLILVSVLTGHYGQYFWSCLGASISLSSLTVTIKAQVTSMTFDQNVTFLWKLGVLLLIFTTSTIVYVYSLPILYTWLIIYLCIKNGKLATLLLIFC